jgi:hypothetical protein
MIYALTISRFVDVDPYIEKIARRTFKLEAVPRADYLDALTVASILGIPASDLFDTVRNSSRIHGFLFNRTELVIHPDSILNELKRKAQKKIRDEFKRSLDDRNLN